MKINGIMNTIVRTVSKTGLKIQKYSPEILLGVGIVTAVAGAVMACKATTKVNDILDKHQTEMDKIHQVADNPDEYEEEYTEEDYKKDKVIVTTHTGLDLAKNYAPAVILGGVSIACLLASHGIIRKRNAGLVAAYASLDEAFKNYRANVIHTCGKAEDSVLLTTDSENLSKADEITDKKGNPVVSNPVCNGFSRVFDKGFSKAWEDDPDYNLMFLRAEQNYANDRLKARGFLFLNEVYELLGFDPTPEGQTVGWIYDPNNPVTDGYVDFGFSKGGLYNDPSDETPTGWILDFNIDGTILDKI